MGGNFCNKAADGYCLDAFIFCLVVEGGVLFRVHYSKRPGAVLNPGTTISKLALDNPDQVKMATPYEGCLPAPSPPPTHGEKKEQQFKKLMEKMKDILNGYVKPEPYFSQELRDSTEQLFEVLVDPVLPLLELQVNDYALR